MVTLKLLWMIPPAFSVTVPTTTLILAPTLPFVHWAVVSTQRLERIEPPQKWKLPRVLSEAIDGTWPSSTAAPPETLPSADSSTMIAGMFQLNEASLHFLWLLTGSKRHRHDGQQQNYFLHHLVNFTLTSDWSLCGCWWFYLSRLSALQAAHKRDFILKIFRLAGNSILSAFLSRRPLDNFFKFRKFSSPTRISKNLKLSGDRNEVIDLKNFLGFLSWLKLRATLGYKAKSRIHRLKNSKLYVTIIDGIVSRFAIFRWRCNIAETQENSSKRIHLTSINKI